MCNTSENISPEATIPQIPIAEAVKQAEFLSPSREECSEETRIQCAMKYGPQAIDNKILVSISENINTMAEAINKSEQQKNGARENFVSYFEFLLGLLILFAGGLIVADTFFGYHVRTEFLISVILAILADVFAIVHTLVKYMTNVEHYSAYNMLIDSLLKHLNRGNNLDKKK